MDNKEEIELLRNLQLDDIPTQEQLKTILKYVENRVALLKSIIHLNPFPVAIWDNNGHFVAGNIGYQELFHGTPPSEYSIFDDPVIQGWEVYERFLEIKKGDVLKFPAVPYNSHDIKPEYPDNPIWFETTITPLENENGVIECYLFVYIDVTEIKQLELENKQLSKEIIDSKVQLLEMLFQFEEKQKLIKLHISNAIKGAMMPILEKMKNKNEMDASEIEALKQNLYNFPDKIVLKNYLLEKNLTLTEINICELIQEEKLLKEIACKLNVNLSTIQSHTKNIRQKLGLTNTNITLADHLQNI